VASILFWQLVRGLLSPLMPGLVRPLLCGGHLLHPNLLISCQCPGTLSGLLLALLDSSLCLSKPYSFQTHLPSFEHCFPPVHLWVESKQEGVSQYEVVPPQVGEEEWHSHHLPLIVDLDPTVIFNLPLLIFSAIYIVHCQRLAELKTPYF